MIFRNSTFHSFSIDDAIKYGIHEAIILGNIQKLGDIKYESLPYYFSYIPQDQFFEILNKLISIGLIIKKDE
jgi:hypothetical protein